MAKESLINKQLRLQKQFEGKTIKSLSLANNTIENGGYVDVCIFGIEFTDGTNIEFESYYSITVKEKS